MILAKFFIVGCQHDNNHESFKQAIWTSAASKVPTQPPVLMSNSVTITLWQHSFNVLPLLTKTLLISPSLSILGSLMNRPLWTFWTGASFLINLLAQVAPLLGLFYLPLPLLLPILLLPFLLPLLHSLNLLQPLWHRLLCTLLNGFTLPYHLDGTERLKMMMASCVENLRHTVQSVNHERDSDELGAYLFRHSTFSFAFGEFHVSSSPHGTYQWFFLEVDLNSPAAERTTLL